MQQARNGCSACPRRHRWPGAQIHAQRHALRRDAERLQRLDNGRACSRHLIGKPQDHCLAQTPAPTPAAAVADAMQRDQLAASDMHHAGTAQQLGSGHRDQAAIARKKWPGSHRTTHAGVHRRWQRSHVALYGERRCYAPLRRAGSRWRAAALGAARRRAPRDCVPATRSRSEIPVSRGLPRCDPHHPGPPVPVSCAGPRRGSAQLHVGLHPALAHCGKRQARVEVRAHLSA